MNVACSPIETALSTVLEHGLMTKAEVWRYTFVTGAIALAAGVYLVIVRGEASVTLFGGTCLGSCLM